MKPHQLWDDLRSSLWFLPAIITLAAVVLAILLILSEGRLKPDFITRWKHLIGSGAAGARDLLAAIATSMITVAGVVFSITIVALSLAASQYSSRVIRNFMHDRINQSVLGIFVGIFAYCLVVLRTIRGEEEGGFVPSMAVLFALLLAFVGIAVFIFFIHHISTSIQASHILSTATKETLTAIDHLFPEHVGEEEESDSDDSELFDGYQQWHPVPAPESGYLQSLDTEGVMAFAAERRTVVRMERSLGQFVVEGSPLASLRGVTSPTDDERRQLSSLYSIGRQRTVQQDAAFGVRQIVDVALKALSPGNNDTTTAVMSIHYLTAILARLTGRRIPSRFREQDGHLRLITQGPTFEGLVNESLDQIRQNASGNLAVLVSLLNALKTVAGQTGSSSRKQLLAVHVRAVMEAGKQSIRGERDRQMFDSKLAAVLRVFGEST